MDLGIPKVHEATWLHSALLNIYIHIYICICRHFLLLEDDSCIQALRDYVDSLV